MAEYEVKQVIVYRRDLKMRKGKIAAQVAHASMKVFFDRRMRLKDFSQAGSGIGKFLRRWGARLGLIVPLTEDMAAWVEGSFAKIVLTVENEEDLLRVYALARAADIPTSLIIDAGNTEFKQECPSCAGTGKTEPVSFEAHPPTMYKGPYPYVRELPAGNCPQCGGSGKIGVPTRTAVAIGPAKREVIDKITGKDGAVPTRLP